MNLHPILVHFPIALFTLYALLECARFKKLQEQAYYFYLKAFLVITGSLASSAAYITGDMQKDQLPADAAIRPIVEFHSTWALATITIFAVIALAYLIAWLNRQNVFTSIQNQTFRRITSAAHAFTQGWIIVPLALAGLISVTITGALGGSIVYGPNIDPVASFIYRLFGLPSS